MEISVSSSEKGALRSKKKRVGNRKGKLIYAQKCPDKGCNGEREKP